MRPPPATLNGAQVLFWTAAEDIPFYYVDDNGETVPIACMAIGKYSYSDCFFLFTCDPQWRVVNDRDFLTRDEASLHAQSLAHAHQIIWKKAS